ncbi:MAG: universal stress protein [Microvirga sp.]|nr:universal stress protein [Microvirga sp.]MDF2973974.1 universal stress protein [Microvirga sp.]
MAFKDLLVLAGNGMEAAGAYGIWLSGACGATITAAAPVIEPSIPPYLALELPGELVSQIERDAQESARKALADFSTAAKQAGVAAETLSFRAVIGRVGVSVSHLARCYDAIVLPQPNLEGLDTTEIVEAALFGSGRPLIIIPFIPARQEFGTVLIAWDGGEPAARAVADAMPILSLARRVQIVTVQRGDPESPLLSRDNLVRHLARHGINAEARQMPSGEVDIANLLLSHAADIGADLMVMGGYGHSRFREVMLGGTTRAILRSMTVPVLMSH